MRVAAESSNQEVAQAILLYGLFALLALAGLLIVAVIFRTWHVALSTAFIESLGYFFVPAVPVTLIAAAAQPSFTVALAWGAGVGGFIFLVGLFVEGLKSGKL